MLTTGLLLCGCATAGDGLPLWEVAIGAFPSTFPAYRGSDQQQSYVLPFPYLVYRGEYLKADREGLRAQLFHSDRVELNVSTNAAIPVSSDEDSSREGMPDLDPALEIGPSLNLTLVKDSRGNQLRLRLPVRAVIATDLRGVEYAGWVFHPHLNLNSEKLRGQWSAGLNLGPLFADREYHAYYYDVTPRFATPDRPAYKAAGGYSGMVALASFSRRFRSFWAGGFLRYDYMGGAEFDDSPLVNSDHSLMAGIAVAWVFATSSERVER